MRVCVNYYSEYFTIHVQNYEVGNIFRKHVLGDTVNANFIPWNNKFLYFVFRSRILSSYGKEWLKASIKSLASSIILNAEKGHW